MPGVGDEHVEPTEPFDRGRDEPLEVVAPGDVDRAGDGGAAACGDLLRERVEPLGAAGAEHDRRAARGQQPRGRGADPAACAGDRDDLAGAGGCLRCLSWGPPCKVDTCPVVLHRA